MKAYTRSGIIILAFGTEGIAAGAAFLLSMLFDVRLFPLSENFIRDIFTGTALALPPLFLAVLMLSSKAGNVSLLRSLRRTVIRAVKLLFANARFPDIVIISFIAGFAEELLFRGVIQARFGIVIASVLFGIVHFVTPAYALMAMLMGGYLGIFFSIYGSLLIPVQIHFIYDLGLLMYLKHVLPEYSEPDMSSRPAPG